MIYIKQTKQQIISKCKKLKKENNKLSADVDYLREDNKGQQTYIDELENRKEQFKEERNEALNDVDTLKKEKDVLELGYLKDIVGLQKKLITKLEDTEVKAPVYNNYYGNENNNNTVTSTSPTNTNGFATSSTSFTT
jgi:predicted nuclease with TOPRIM domain|tara:strand:- start:823 stop:1233 length:411 start_codon:yes stop_codon:yes gene_type:complete